MLFYIIPSIFCGIIIVFFWDRRVAMRLIGAKIQKVQNENFELKREISLIKESLLKLEERVLKSENDFGRIAKIDPRFSRTV